jgi:hypothetical protein
MGWFGRFGPNTSSFQAIKISFRQVSTCAPVAELFDSREAAKAHMSIAVNGEITMANSPCGRATLVEKRAGFG